jgi:N-methylhydantoinase B/oxoprolinase/acetone carboxylase alpha subunit
MNEMKISTRLMKGLIAKIVKTMIKKKVGYDVDIRLNDLVITNDNDKAHVHLNVDAEMNKDELAKILKATGLT